MSKLTQRLLLFFVGVPLVIAIVTVNFCHFLLLAIVNTTFAFLASRELYALFSVYTTLPPQPWIIALATAIPVGAYGIALGGLPFAYITWILLGSILLVLIVEAVRRKTFTHANESVALAALIVLYGGYLMTFVFRITRLEYASYYICCFFCMVFFCDSGAWLLGMTLGKSNRGLCAVSPNKSIAGFMGGYAGAIAGGIVLQQLFPAVFGTTVIPAVVLGSCTATAAIVGDLIESLVKRSPDY
ncbi:MAG: phosphatidate cytidylyltransferase [Treponema sp.]|nr:phosphatidate cytidylyltransferase [Treponema sp.]